MTLVSIKVLFAFQHFNLSTAGYQNMATFNWIGMNNAARNTLAHKTKVLLEMLCLVENCVKGLAKMTRVRTVFEVPKCLPRSTELINSSLPNYK